MTLREGLTSFIEDRRSSWEVPGCAVAAVKDGEVVLHEAFGLRDRERGLPVTTDTLFPIGSTTKAFTSAAVAAMVDDGLVEWDTPVREYVADFRLHDPVATDRITPLDLLCHRTGLPRHEFAWMAHPERSRADIVSRLRHLPPSKDIREEFQYCNLGYVAAGHLIEVVTGMTWEEYVASRLLKPLGMDRSTFTVADTRRDGDHSLPYERRQEVVVEVPFRIIDQAAPAGGISSCTSDMLAWLRLHLGAGADGSAVITPENLRQLHAPHMVVPEDRVFPELTHFAYGLGWSIGQYRGRWLVEHGGGIDGFITEFMFLPGDGIGVVVLTNSTSGGLGATIAYRVLDELLGLDPLPWHDRFMERYQASLEGTRDAHAAAVRRDAPMPRSLESYEGAYEHPGYGTLTIDVADGRLVPRFGTLDITLAHRHFDAFDLEWRELGEEATVFPLMFETGPDGDITALTVPFEPSVDPIRFVRAPDAQARDPERLRTLVGTYHMGPIELVVTSRAGSILMASFEGAPPAELIPARGLRFGVKGDASVTVEFVLSATGSVEKVVVQPVGNFTPDAT